MTMLRRVKNFAHLWQARKAARKHGQPHKHLKIIGVSGTDGKTTTVALLYHILSNTGHSTGFISTTEARIGKKSLDTGLHVTSPDPWQVPAYLAQMADAGIEYVVLETTSQGLDQNRFGDIKFDAAVITNVREDHLDYHGDWEGYAAAKFRLIRKVKDEGVAVLNADDEPAGSWLRRKAQKLPQTLYVIWSSKGLVTSLKLGFATLSFKYKDVQFDVPIFGAKHNLENVLQAILLCETIMPLEDIAASLHGFVLPLGRMEAMALDPVRVVVDFAHTPASLETALQAVRPLLPRGKRIITVFGCAGKRDKGRRRMGEVSARLADITIATAEDPRNERLATINSEIIGHAKAADGECIMRFAHHEDYTLTSIGEVHAQIESTLKSGLKPVITFDEDNRNSRRDAIELAIRVARPGDCVFVTGKGHERSLAFGKEEKEYPWSDQDEVKAALKRLKLVR